MNVKAKQNEHLVQKTCTTDAQKVIGRQLIIQTIPINLLYQAMLCYICNTEVFTLHVSALLASGIRSSMCQHVHYYYSIFRQSLYYPIVSPHEFHFYPN